MIYITKYSINTSKWAYTCTFERTIYIIKYSINTRTTMFYREISDLFTLQNILLTPDIRQLENLNLLYLHYKIFY